MNTLLEILRTGVSAAIAAAPAAVALMRSPTAENAAAYKRSLDEWRAREEARIDAKLLAKFGAE